MALFAIMTETETPTLVKELSRLFPGDHRKVGYGQWILSSPGTTIAKEISDTLGITDGRSGSAIVVRIGGYYGRANPEIWEWMKARLDVERV